MRPMRECPKKGCEIEVPPDRWGCTKHWNELSWDTRRDWMRGRYDEGEEAA